jgi:hypothetical protein
LGRGDQKQKSFYNIRREQAWKLLSLKIRRGFHLLASSLKGVTGGFGVAKEAPVAKHFFGPQA